MSMGGDVINSVVGTGSQLNVVPVKTGGIGGDKTHHKIRMTTHYKK
jgi:hypothetical protein